MSIKYVGRLQPKFKGKPLWEILYRLKDFGVGRVVHRHSFSERYDQPCYWIITRVEPVTPENFQTCKAYGTKIFRGIKIGEEPINVGFKPDWRLVHKEEEAQFLSEATIERPVIKVNKHQQFPPLLERMMIQEQKSTGVDNPDVPTLTVTVKDTKYRQVEYVDS